MGYNIELSQNGKLVHATDLCTNQGYSNLCGWFDSLPRAKYAALAALSASGEFAGTEQLAAELENAIAQSPPADADTLHVANRLADLLGAGEPGESVAVVP